MSSQRFSSLQVLGGLLLASLSGLLLPACGGSETEPAKEDRGAEPSADPVAQREAGSTEAAQPVARMDDVAAKMGPELAPGELPGIGMGPTGGLQNIDSLLAQPFSIDGEVVPVEELKRAIIFGPRGRSFVEMSKMSVYVNQEIAQRIREGEAGGKYSVTDDEVSQVIDKARGELLKEFPDGNVQLKHVMPDGVNGIDEKVRVRELFRKLYLPENPYDFPDATTNALLSQENGQQLIDHLKQSWDREQNAEDEAMAEGGRAMLMALLTQQITAHLQETAEVVKVGLPEDVLMRVNGVDVRLADVWDRIAADVSEVDLRTAKQWVANMKLSEKALKEAGVWITDEELEQLYAAHVEPFIGSFFSIEKVATSVKKFPTQDDYKAYFRVLESYRRLVQEELTEDYIEEWRSNRTDYLLGSGKIDVDIILLSAYDFEERSWRENGWEDAQERAVEVLRLLVEEERPWGEVLQQYSDFYDPPVAQSQLGQERRGVKNKGRFRGLTRNEFLSTIGESEFWNFLNGGGLGDFVFFEQEPGAIEPPMRGPHGWYIPRLIERTPPLPKVDQDEELVRDLVTQDIMSCRLNEYVLGLVEQADIAGL